MSFSADTKSELIKLPVGKKCCKLAYAAAFLLDSDTDFEERIIYSNKSESVCLAAQRAISMAFGKDTLPSVPVLQAIGYDLAIKSKSAVELLKNVKVNGLDKNILNCSECRVAFLRGLFVSQASVTDPENQYHIEFLFRNVESADTAHALLSDIFGEPRKVKRKTGIGLVYKSSTVIEEILSVIGANQAYFVLLNQKINREIRNNENRATNCETRNISMSVDAAQRQISAIEKLKAENKFNELPQSLKETAEMRLLYPSLPLSELANKFAPPLTKSGLNNRLKKIMELAN